MEAKLSQTAVIEKARRFRVCTFIAWGLLLRRSQTRCSGLPISFQSSQSCPRPLARQDSTQEISCSVSEEDIGSQALIKASIWFAWIWLCIFSLFKTFTFHTAEKSIWSPTLENNDFSLAKNFHSQVCRNDDESVHTPQCLLTSNFFSK